MLSKYIINYRFAKMCSHKFVINNWDFFSLSSELFTLGVRSVMHIIMLQMFFFWQNVTNVLLIILSFFINETQSSLISNAQIQSLSKFIIFLILMWYWQSIDVIPKQNVFTLWN